MIVIVNVNGSGDLSGQDSLAELQSYAAKLPLPSGSTLTHETARKAEGDANAYLQRNYRLTDGTRPTADIKSALQQGGCRLADPRTGTDEAVDSTLFAESSAPDSGDVYVLPPGTRGAGFELTWKGAELTLRASGGDVRGA
ncbi:hypothetical protein [uncultured Jatrophihabitans sp.]|uniref:hypothetical protein n=1 Tax=uncultured Jatrophihabitans sp. TaxID=1610747 RepID=UPI0035CAF2C3